MLLSREKIQGKEVILFTKNSKKHAYQSLEEVAEKDPGYLQWVYEKGSDDLPKDILYALQDVMEKFDIEIP